MSNHTNAMSNHKLASAKDNLFDNSSMTFREHLDELRKCLVKAIIALSLGLLVGLYFANDVVKYVADPLRAAILEFNAQKDLALMGFEKGEDEAKNARLMQMVTAMRENSLKFQVVYELPKEAQAFAPEILAAEAKEQAKKDGDEDNQAASDEGSDEDPDESSEATIRDYSQVLQYVPDPSSLTPRVQMVRDSSGLSSFKMEEPFMIWVKAGLIVGAVVSSPAVFYFLWQFIAAGLHRHERRYVYIYLPVSVTLFVSGVVLAFFLVLHYVLQFLLDFNGSMDVSVEPRLTYYINFVLLLPLGFGLAFQLPLVMLFLQRIGLIETAMYANSWRIAILVIMLLSMLLTPADVTSMIALAIPLIFLYFLGILMCHFIPRGPGLGSGAYDPT
ncbi:Sec-independent protein translocase protein TatCy [Stieleria bergensis]|uniref:Sec-independent protein translocase protein TatC n=1 Tax=Stieleria bergensis TaxID=2528025 RepID=A0A517T073_9BACT|nr:Sec-independent protein translocase protein TatCy [Planctomycetes bacterium SV_7m_r]